MFFLTMFPWKALTTIVNETNKQLLSQNHKETTTGEILKFFGVWILMTRFEFTDRRGLWSTSVKHKYQMAASFGITGLSRDRFDYLWKSIRFSNQPNTRPPMMSSERYRWMLVDDFVSLFNNHRRTLFDPSSILTVDESMVRW